MKPSQKSTPETMEDFDVWLWVAARWRCKLGLVTRMTQISCDSDRRDADLMFRAQNYRLLRTDCTFYDLDETGMRIYLGGDRYLERGAERLS